MSHFSDRDSGRFIFSSYFLSQISRRARNELKSIRVLVGVASKHLQVSLQVPQRPRSDNSLFSPKFLNDGPALGAVLVGVTLETLTGAGAGVATATARAFVVYRPRWRVVVDYEALGA